MAHFHVTVIRPDGYRHSDCFSEIVYGLRSALLALGHWATFSENTIYPNVTTILLGAHLLTEQSANSLPYSVIVFNLEQLGVSTLPHWYMGLASRLRIWDFTPAQLEVWKKYPCIEPPKLVEIGFVPELRRIASVPAPDIDVLFYGSTTDRRRHILNALAAAGVRVHASFGVYGWERDALIARAKIVLNIHAAGPPAIGPYVGESPAAGVKVRESSILEIVRVSYLLANAKAVVTEESADMGSLVDAVAVFPYDRLVEGCVHLLQHDTERLQLAERGFRLFSARSQARILASVLAGGTDQV